MGVWNTLLILLLLKTFYFQTLFASTIEDSNKLSADLMKGYNKLVRGQDDQSELTYVVFSFQLIRIADYEEVSGKLAMVGYFYFEWKDDRMKWDPDAYNETNTILFEEKDVWKPLIILSSSHEDFKRVGNDAFFIRYFPDGKAQWLPGDIFITSCTPDIYRYPYDIQTCHVTFSPWGYGLNEIKFISVSEEINLSLYSKHGVWDIVETYSAVFVNQVGNYQYIGLTIKMSRQSTFLLINMIFPIVFMGFLNIFVFILPAESGERVGYCITVLLAIAVFQTIATDKLPNVSWPRLSILCVKLLVDLLLSVLVMICAIFTLFIYHQPEKRKVPRCLASVSSFILCGCCACCHSNKTNDTRSTSTFEVYKIKNGKGVTELVSLEDDSDSEISWSDVGKASDIVSAVFSMIAFITTNVVYFVFVTSSHNVVP